MRKAEHWKDFEILDTSRGERLERWGDVILIRPDPQILWDTPRENPLWRSPHAHYHRSAKGGGAWETFKKSPDSWQIGYEGLTFKVSPTGFKHTGLFPEQAVNWDYLSGLIRKLREGEDREVSVLNLFAYTGGATLACAQAGAKVCHVDASKGMVTWARENAGLSGLEDSPVRYIVDDCKKFVEREYRRGNRYDIIVMDPPSYGRGPSGEIWKLEDAVHGLVEACAQVLKEEAFSFLLNSYTTGLSPSVMAYILGVCLAKRFGGTVQADEIGLEVRETGFCLPCGSTAIWRGAGLEYSE